MSDDVTRPPEVPGTRFETATFIGRASGAMARYGQSWLMTVCVCAFLLTYQPSRLGSDQFWQALVGHLVSPSRGC